MLTQFYSFQIAQLKSVEPVCIQDCFEVDELVILNICICLVKEQYTASF